MQKKADAAKNACKGLCATFYIRAYKSRPDVQILTQHHTTPHHTHKYIFATPFNTPYDNSHFIHISTMDASTRSRTRASPSYTGPNERTSSPSFARSPSPPARERKRSNSSASPDARQPQRPKTDAIADAIETINRPYNNLATLSRELQDCEEVVLADVAKYGMALASASRRLCDLKRVVHIAVHNNGNALQYASERLRNDSAVVEAAVRSTGFAIKHADPSLLDNQYLVLLAVQENGRVLEHLDARWKGDRAIVLAAVKQTSCAFEHASNELKSDQEVIAARDADPSYNA